MILIFTEALAKTGLGHLGRCTALAEILESYGKETRIVLDGDGTALAQPHDPRILEYQWKDPSLLASILRKENPTMCFVDSYLADLSVYDRLIANDRKLICIDDYKRIDYPEGALILNPGIGGKKLPYDYAKYEILAGIEYVLLRVPFRKEFFQKPIAQKISAILITVGSEDRWNIVPKITDFFAKEYPDYFKYIVVGAAFENIDAIKLACDSNSKILQNLSAIEMRDLMLNMDVAISAGGQTTYELARCGIPMILLEVAKNQSGNIAGWIDYGIIHASCGDRAEAINFIRSEMRRLAPVESRKAARLLKPENLANTQAYEKLVA